jgi:energy-coupling factor transporter ATP-binding protein EcfA2
VRFKKITIPKDITQKSGIESIDIQCLSNVIAFVSKNGSGKTRILDLIENHPCSTGTKFETIPNDLKTQFIELEKSIELANLLTKLNNSPNDYTLMAKIKNLQQFGYDDNFKKILPKITIQISKKFIRRIKQEEISSLQLIFKEAAEQKSFEDLLENTVSDINYNELSSINRGALKYFINLPHKLVADKINCEDKEDLYSKVSYKRFASLKNYVKILLNKELEWEGRSTSGKFLDTADGGYNATYQGIFKLDKRIFRYDEFSDGEKILFSYALLFFLLEQNEKLNIKESILIIDEPELHLHADSEIDLIGRLRETISEKGQLIIATHSINILSTLNYEDIFVVKNGEILCPSQKSLATSLEELIGIGEKITKLSDLLYSIDNWSFINFMSQCFSEPETIKTAKENDQQLESIKKMIKEKINDSHSIFFVFGFGRGRIFEGLLSDSGIFPKLKYHALEPKKENHSELKKLGVMNIYSDYNELSDNSFDFILLANVLHEIPILAWENTINKVIDSLKEDGSLMIVEPKVLSKGEKIDDSGFIVLKADEIQILFELSDNLQPFFIEDHKEKITSVLIQKPKIKKVNKESITKTLCKVKENSVESVKELVTQNDESMSNYSKGKKMAFHAMQLMNAQLCLNKIKES